MLSEKKWNGESMLENYYQQSNDHNWHKIGIKMRRGVKKVEIKAS